MLEVGVHHAVGVTLAANTDAFEHTVASQLVKHQCGVNDTGCLLLVGDDATNEVGVSLVEHVHQVVQRLTVDHAGMNLIFEIFS